MRFKHIIVSVCSIERDTLVLSVQVLGEFFNVVTRHIPKPMTSDEAREIMAIFTVTASKSSARLESFAKPGDSGI